MKHIQPAISHFALLLVLAPVAFGQAAPKQESRTVSFTQPRKDGQLECAPDPGAVFKCSVSGGTTAASQGQRLLLWVRPVQPQSESEGWYLQRRPNGVTDQSSSSWKGVIQLGNRDYPPHDGDVIDVAISVVDAATADGLMRKPGVVIERDPIGMPGAKSENVRLRIPKH